MLWTVAVIADSAQFFYELFIRRLNAEEREALWQDYVRFAELFGMPRAAAPATYDDFRAYWRRKLASDELHLTDEARYIGYATAFEIPFPRHQQAAKRVHDADHAREHAATRSRAVRAPLRRWPSRPPSTPPRPRCALVAGSRRNRWPAATTPVRSRWSPGPRSGGSSGASRRRRSAMTARSSRAPLGRAA